MPKKVSAESVAIVAVGVALAGLVQVRFSGLEKRILAVRKDVSDLAQRIGRVGGILTAEFGYARKSESSGGSEDLRVAEIIPPS